MQINLFLATFVRNFKDKITKVCCLICSNIKELYLYRKCSNLSCLSKLKMPLFFVFLHFYLEAAGENGWSLLLDWTAYSFNHGFTNCSLSLSLALANLVFDFLFQFNILSSFTFTLALARMEFLFLKNLRCGKVWKSLIFGKQDFPTKESCTFSHN